MHPPSALDDLEDSQAICRVGIPRHRNRKTTSERYITYWLLQIRVFCGNGFVWGMVVSPPGPTIHSNAPEKGGWRRKDSLITAWRLSTCDKRELGGIWQFPRVSRSMYRRSCHTGGSPSLYRIAISPADVDPAPASVTSGKQSYKQYRSERSRVIDQTHWSIHTASCPGPTSCVGKADVK